MLFLNCLFFIINCTKNICFTKDNYYETKFCNSSNTITNIDESEDITDKILEYLMPLDTDISLRASSNTNIKFQMNIFNYKKVFLDLYSATIDVSKVHGIDASFSSGSFRLIGSSLRDDQTSFYLSSSKIISEVNEIRIKNLTVKSYYELYAKKITVNSFYFIRNYHILANLTNDSLFIKPLYSINWTHIHFTGENKTFTINISDNYQYQQYNLTINNQGTDIDFFDFRSVKNIILNGKGFKTHNLMTFTRCNDIISNVDCIIFAPIYMYISNSFIINVSKSLVIKGDIIYTDLYFLILDTVMRQPNSRISIEIESISNSFRLYIQSSYLDVTINHLNLERNNYKIIPCVGFSGSSSTTILDGPVMKIIEYDFTVAIDITNPYPTDDYLSLLMSKNWSSIIFKSFDQNIQDREIELRFDKHEIHGFMSYFFDDYTSNTILKGKLISTNDSHIISLIPSSYSTIPSFLCYTNSNEISNGQPFNDLTLLNDLIPDDQKVINFVIDKKGTDFDISTIKARNITVKIRSTDSGSLKSLKMDCDNINHLIFDTLNFESEIFQLNVKNITFKNITTHPSNFVFDEQTVIYFDIISITNLSANLECTFPCVKVYIEKYSDLFGYKPTFYFYLYNNYINISTSKYSYVFTTTNIPNIEFQFFNFGNYQSFRIFNNATSLKSISFIPLDASTESEMNVHLDNFESIITANSINIDLSNYTQKSYINFGGFVWKDWFSISADRFEVDNQNIFNSNNFCVCNDEESCNNFCEDYMTKVSYSEFTEKIKTTSEGSVQIIIVGSNNEIDVPLINLDYVDHKEVLIFGFGTNPKIKIDSSSKFTDTSRRVTIYGCTILSDSSKGNIFISNLNVKEDCTIDESWKEISLVSNNLNISVLQLSFKSIHVNKILFLYGDARKTEAKTKVTFSPHAKFEYSLPYTITIKDCMLIIKEIDFNLTQVVPLFSIEDKRFYPFDKETLFTINAIDANLDVLDSNITFSFHPDDFRIIGNFINENPTKFIVLGSTYSNFFLQAENIPLMMTCTSGIYIILEKERVSIAGCIEFAPNINDRSYQIYSSIDEKTVFYVKDLFFDFYYGALVFFNSTKTEMIIGNFEAANSGDEIVFNILVDSNNHNFVQFLNKVNCDTVIFYKVQLLVPGNIYDQQILNFINNNYTLLVLNELNKITTSCINEIKFLSNITGFTNDNFKLIVNENKLLLTTIQSPQILLRYGNCSSCVEVEITDDDVNNIEKFFLNDSPVISVTFYDSNSPDLFLNFDTNGIKIQSLTLKSTEFLNSYVKLGNSVSELNIENINAIIEDTDFVIQKAKVTEGAKFNDLTYYSHINSLEIDQKSLFISEISEFINPIDISVDSLYEINFTTTGVKLVNSELQTFNIDISKIKKACLIIESNESPIINLEEDVSKINQLNSIAFNSSNISIGSGWDRSSTKIEYIITNEENKNIRILSDSFPFYSWDLMFDHPINLTSNLSPFIFSDENLLIHNKNLKINIPLNEVIIIGGLIMSDNSSATVSKNSTLIINNLTVLNGTSQINNSIINNEITLGKESIINGNFTIKEDLSVLNIEWDLNQAPLINCFVSQKTIPKRINIVYNGSEINGREKQFDIFLSKGAVLMTNVSNPDMINNIHFISNVVNEFNDGDKLILKCIYAYDKKIKLISTKLFIEEKDEIEYTTNSIESITETETPSKGDEPSIGDSFQSTSSTIELTEDGFIDGENFVHVDDNDDDNIKFIKTNQKSLTLKAKNNDTPNKELFVSPQIQDTIITISPPLDESNDYGKSRFGIHANSKNPTVNIHNEKVPLNIFNNEKSDINFILNKKQKSMNSKISLQKLIISNGDLKIFAPNEIDGIEFSEVESYLNGNMRSFNADQKSTEISIGTLKLNSGSSVKMTNIFFNQTIELKSNSMIEIERKAVFNEKSVINIDETSFINFGQSEVNGICDKIRVNHIQSKRMIDLIKNAVSSEIICGEKFDCIEWKEKIETNSFYRYSQCIQKKNNEMCLVVSNKEQQPKKKKLSAGVIAAIAVSVCAVVIAVAVIVIILVKKKNMCQKSDEQSQEEGNSGLDDYY